MPGIDDIAMMLSERLSKGKIVLIDKEPWRHDALRNQRTKLFSPRTDTSPSCSVR